MTTLGDDNIRRVLADPPLIWSVVAPDKPELVDRERARPRGLLARLFGRKPAPADPFPLWLSDGEGKQLDLDKAWHGIHFLLCGDAWEGDLPLGFIVSSGTPIGDEDVGYGPARAFSSEQVTEIAEALDAITPESLKARFDRAAFEENGIYPNVWDESPDDCFDQYLLVYYSELKKFVQMANAAGKGILVYLN